MEWISIVMIAPILWALTNYIDKFLLRRHIATTQDVITLLVFSTITSLFTALPIAFFLSPDVFAFSSKTILILVTVGILGALAVWLYLLALEHDDVSTAVPLFQTIPLFGIIFSYFLLSETITFFQFVACACIMLGSVSISLDFTHARHVTLKYRLLALMLGSSACFALFETLFKYAAIDVPFATAIFWEHVGLVLVSMILLCIPNVRMRFLNVFTQGGLKLVGVNVTGELLTTVGNVLTNYTLLVAPVALVLSVSGTTPMFALALGVFFTIVAPQYVQESLEKRVLVQKFFSISIIVTGIVMLY